MQLPTMKYQHYWITKVIVSSIYLSITCTSFHILMTQPCITPFLLNLLHLLLDLHPLSSQPLLWTQIWIAICSGSDITYWSLMPLKLNFFLFLTLKLLMTYPSSLIGLYFHTVIILLLLQYQSIVETPTQRANSSSKNPEVLFKNWRFFSCKQ